MQARMNAILVTGAAGFIGFHVTSRLLERGEQVLGLDNLNAYYDPALKRARLAHFNGHPRFTFVQADVSDRNAIVDVSEAYDVAFDYRVRVIDRIAHACLSG